MSDLPPFGQPDADSLASLIFELAAQLHIERSRRLALETALIQSGALTAEALTAAGETSEFLGAARTSLDHSMRKLMRVLAENEDVRTPLRTKMPGESGGQS